MAKDRDIKEGLDGPVQGTYMPHPSPPPNAASPSPVSRGVQDDFMDEHTVLNIRKAWFSKLQFSKGAEGHISLC